MVVNDEKMRDDLESNWSVVSEAIQTILRREKYPEPYETVKNLTRGNHKVNKKIIHQFIDTLKVKEEIKKELKKINPYNYTGISSFK